MVETKGRGDNHFVPQIDPARCTGCGLCVTVCPHRALALQKGLAVVLAAARCNYEAACQAICPAAAISLPYEIK